MTKTTILAAALAVLPFAALADDMADSKSRVIEALSATLGAKNAAAVDDYFGPVYTQHNPSVPDGVDALKGLIENLGDLELTTARVIADGDLVAMHNRYVGFGPEPMIAFDVFRLEDGKIVEHWDNMIVEAAPNPSGRTQIDGATEIADLDKTEANKAKVEEFITRSLINHEEVTITDYISPETYIQHNPMVADGLDGFGAFMAQMAEQGIAMEYDTIHKVIGEGNFVLAMSEGSFGGEAQAFYDLFRLEDGLIVEHWDVIAPMPGDDAEHNEAGKF